MSFNKELFAKLLHEAKGERSINQYGLHADISAAHISRLLRQKIDTPPNPDTIRKLVDKAYNDITYEQFMKAAGHLQGDEIVMDNQVKAVNIKEDKKPKDLKRILEQHDIMFDGVPIDEDAKKEIMHIVEFELYKRAKELNKRKKATPDS